jgi:hypothetical protein
MSASRKWLEPFSWEFVTAQNEALCQAKSAHHGPTSDGHEAARALWEAERLRVLELFEAVELCRKCHRLGPFTNFNGNTFSAVARILVRRLELSPEEEHLIRSLAGHIVAGVAGEEEVRAFREFCASLG